MKLLHIDSSISGEASASRQLSAAITAAFERTIPGLVITRRDFDADPIPHLDSTLLPTIKPSNAPQRASGIPNGTGMGALEEFLAADIIVIGAPMYNFTVPSQVKAWLDRIVIAGKTFRYTDSGSVGLAAGKKVVIASTRGGLYAAGMPSEANDFQETYLRAIFGFIGIEDIAIVRAEALALGPAQREASMRAALLSIHSTIAGFITRQAA